MAVYVIPINLKRAKEDVLKKHSKEARVRNQSKDYLKELIDRIVKQPYKSLDVFVKLLDYEQMSSVCRYVVTNSYNVPLNNLLRIIDVGASATDIRELIYGWENRYHADTSNDIRMLLSDLLDKDNRLGEAIESMNSNMIELKKWLPNKEFDQILLDYISKCKKLHEVDKLLVSLGVMEGTCLFTDTRRQYYSICKREAYLNIDDRELARTFQVSDSIQKQKIIVNFLSEVFYSDLIHFIELFNVIDSFVKKNILHKFHAYLEQNNVLSKYNYWKNIILLQDNLDPDRFEFWQEYAIGNDIDFDSSIYLLYIDFGEYVLTEFKGKAGGPAYLFDKASFKKYSISAKSKYWPKAKMQKYLYNDLYEKRVKGLLGRMEHKPSPGWRSDFKNILNKYNIIPIEMK